MELSQEIDSLKEKLSDLKPSPEKKRKRPDEDVVPVPRSPKKSKQSSSPVKKQAHSVDAAEWSGLRELGEVGTCGSVDVAEWYSPVTGNILMRSIYQIHSQLNSHDKTEPQALAYHLIRAAASIPQVITRVTEQAETHSQIDVAALQSVITAATRVWRTFLQGYNRLFHVAGGPEFRGQVVHAILQTIRKLLEYMDKISRMRPSQETPKAASTQSRAKTVRSVAARENRPLDLFTTLVTTFVDDLDPAAESHLAMFEGFSYAVLERLGPKLYVIAFRHPRFDTIEEEILAGSPTESDTSGTKTRKTLVSDELAAAMTEAPYLIHILNRMVTATQFHFGAVDINNANKSKTAGSKIVAKTSLTVVAKERLQRTLVQCVFGAEGAERNDPFKDCLNLPVPTGQTVQMPKQKDVDICDWFKEEVWRLVGWDILAGEGDW